MKKNITVIQFVALLLIIGCADDSPAVSDKTSGSHEYTPDAELQSLLDIPEEIIFEFNMNVGGRDRLLGLLDGSDAKGDITRFDAIDAEVLEMLIRKQWADPRDKQNAAPSLGEFFLLMKRWPQVRAFGYAVSSLREDYRVSLEGAFVDPAEVTPELKRVFIDFAKEADEISTEQGLYVWWD